MVDLSCITASALYGISQRMIRHMIQRDPAERLTAEEYLKVYKGPYIYHQWHVYYFVNCCCSQEMFFPSISTLSCMATSSSSASRCSWLPTNASRSIFIHSQWSFIVLVWVCYPSRLYRDVEAILANLLLDKRHEDRETGYGGSTCVPVRSWIWFLLSLDALVIILSAITSHLRLTQVRKIDPYF